MGVRERSYNFNSLIIFMEFGSRGHEFPIIVIRAPQYCNHRLNASVIVVTGCSLTSSIVILSSSSSQCLPVSYPYGKVPEVSRNMHYKVEILELKGNYETCTGEHSSHTLPWCNSQSAVRTHLSVPIGSACNCMINDVYLFRSPNTIPSSFMSSVFNSSITSIDILFLRKTSLKSSSNPC